MYEDHFLLTFLSFIVVKIFNNLADMSLRKTKIACTLGKVSSSKEMIIELINAGMDIARISDRFLEIDKQIVLTNLREAMVETGAHIGIMLGLRESDLRLGNFNSKIIKKFSKGENVQIISSNNKNLEGDNILHCNNKELPSLVEPGDKLLIDFGKIIFTVISIENLHRGHSSSTHIELNKSSTEINQNYMHTVKSLEDQINSIHSPKYLRSDSFNNTKRPRRVTPKLPKAQKKAKIVVCTVDHDCILSEHKPVHIRPAGSKKPPISSANDIKDFDDIR